MKLKFYLYNFVPESDPWSARQDPPPLTSVASLRFHNAKRPPDLDPHPDPNPHPDPKVPLLLLLLLLPPPPAVTSERRDVRAPKGEHAMANHAPVTAVDPNRMVARYECNECKESLYGGKYILQEENPYCLTCYEKAFSNTCEVCNTGISCTTKVGLRVLGMGMRLHCGRWAERPFATRDDMIMCVECYSDEYSAKCFACLKTIMPGTKKMEHKGNSWHENCFTCQHCQQPIGTRSFVKKEGSNYCLPCYEKQFADLCVHCKKECFVCISCKQQLSGQRFTKYISFEERQWHNGCFNCKKCSVSLIGRGFLTRPRRHPVPRLRQGRVRTRWARGRGDEETIGGDSG
ncbi:hypothetical protein CRUP_036473 [Coryphaenoides rupestris]|nr:hypothetical protein CRUP_036473 [Coryphaenoides rupestris]